MAFDYNLANISDGVALIGELEHIRRHALRSAQLSATEGEAEDAIFYMVTAKRAQDLRRKYMAKHFSAPEKLHCLGKCSAAVRQLAYETDTGDADFLHEVDELVDSVWGKITGEDLSGCESCRKDQADDIMNE